MVNYTFLLIGIIYTTFLPGFVLTEFLLPKFEFWKKIPLYLLGSTIISTYFTYLVSLVFGFNRTTLFWSFFVFLILFVVLVLTRKLNIDHEIKKNWSMIITGVIVYIVFFVSLYPAIFSLHNDYFVMAGPNWQDTAMHTSIIESLAQGNFPPKAPYFSGQDLTYYYFSDFHAAIINTFYGSFFPQVLVLVNPFFAVLFFFSVYALTFSLIKKKLFSILAGIMTVFYGNLGFIYLFQQLIHNPGKYIDLVTANPFSSNATILQMVPMTDYFLQNRPMMVGLPAVVLITLLLLNKKYLIAGILTAALLKFQMFGFLVGWIIFGSVVLFEIIDREVKVKLFLRKLVLFLVPTLIFGLIFATGKVENRTILTIFMDSFSWGPWQKSSLSWFSEFIITNFGIGLYLMIFTLIFKRIRSNKNLQPILLTAFIIFTIPFVMRFTIYPFDMFKFFYYFVPFVCITLAIYYSESIHKKFALTFLSLVVVISSLTSINVLANSYLNKNQGYSMADYNSGIWIRNNIPEKSIFVTMPTVHSAPTDIGGRLRIISYINWPYSHGFNVGNDNVFSRVKDVEAVYRTGDVSLVRVKYEAKYIFYGDEERSKFPDAGKLFAQNSSLKQIYNSNEVEIYAIY